MALISPNECLMIGAGMVPQLDGKATNKIWILVQGGCEYHGSWIPDGLN